MSPDNTDHEQTFARQYPGPHDMLARARSLKADLAAGVANDRRGLCFHLGGSGYLRELFTTWPEWSGCKIFPVPSPYAVQAYMSGFFESVEELRRYHKQAANRAYLYTSGSLYDGEYGAARLRLLDHIIATLEARL